MKRFLIIVAALAIAVPALAFGRETSAWMQRANILYELGEFDSAAIYYDRIVESGVNNSAVFFNLGNSYYRQGKIGWAILNYEKARILSPNDPDILANLRFANLNTQDRTPEPQRGFVETILWRLHTLFSLNQQVWIVLGLIGLLSVFFSLALFASRNIRLWLIYVSSLLFIFLAAVGLSAGYKIYQAESTSYAIVLEKAVDAKNQPNGTTVLFTAHEGTKFRLRKNLDNWYLVSLPNGVSGWVDGAVLGKI